MFAPIHTWSQSLSEVLSTSYDTAKMAIYRLQSAYLSRGWTQDVVVTVSPQGMITAIDTSPNAGPNAGPNASPNAAPMPTPAMSIERVAGLVIPGMPNAHSHAFQRAMAGNAEFRSSARDSFWSWRQAMYALANRIGPEELRIVATQLFVEMLKSGYTSVAEFHYLHRPSGEKQYAGANLLWEAIGNAADTAGIGLTFLPTLYQTSDFGAAPLKPEQARFALQTDAFLRPALRRLAGRHRLERSDATA
jgi:formimidoylglutamate deiminase